MSYFLKHAGIPIILALFLLLLFYSIFELFKAIWYMDLKLISCICFAN